MKQFTKLFAALAAVFLMVAFAGCNNSNSPADSGPAVVVAEFSGTHGTEGESGYAIHSIEFYSDNTYIQ